MRHAQAPIAISVDDLVTEARVSRPVAVIGYGVTGQAAVRYLRAQGRQVVLLDTRPAPQPLPDALQGVQCHWQAHEWPALAVDFAVLSPGLALDSCLVGSARAAGVDLVSDIDVFFAAAQAPVLAVTGTNGKSTVTSLAGHLLGAAGLDCGTGGNLGEAALDLLSPARDCYVLELSSFQLERSALHGFAAATVLNVTPDHLDLHGDLAAYLAAKQRIFASSDQLVFNRDDAATRPQPRRDDARLVSFGSDAPDGENWGLVEQDGQRWLARGETLLCTVDDLPLSGAHNELNVLAALALVWPWLGELSQAEIVAALRSFHGLPHRFETLELGGVRWVNDSKATNTGATVAALLGLPRDGSTVLIAGGDAKGADLTTLGPALSGCVGYVVTLGRDGPAVGKVAAAQGISTQQVSDMRAAVALAAAQVGERGTVLLSPACASLDMYTNFEARGRAFLDAVRDLGRAGGDHG